MSIKRISVAGQIVSPPNYFQQLTIDSLSATLDEAWSPSYQATLTAPYSPALAAVDPRNSEVQILLTLTEEYGRAMTVAEITAAYTGTVSTITASWGGLTVAQITNLLYFSYTTGTAGYIAPTVRTQLTILRSSTIDYASQSITLNVASAESLLQDDALIATTDYTPPQSLLIDIIDATLNRIGRELWEYASGLQDITIPAANRIWKRGQSAFDYLNGLCRASDVLLYARFDGRMVLRPAWTVAESVPPLILSPATNLIAAEEKRSRDDTYYSAAILTYRWTDASNVAREVSDFWDSGAYPRKVYQETIEAVFPGSGIARNYLTSLQARGRQVDVEAVADYASTWLGNTATLTTEAGIMTGQLQKVTWQHPADRMQLTLRIGA